MAEKHFNLIIKLVFCNEKTKLFLCFCSNKVILIILKVLSQLYDPSGVIERKTHAQVVKM